VSDKTKKKTTVRISPRLKQEISKHMAENGYGLHGKSKWLASAITEFDKIPNNSDLISQAIEINPGGPTLVEGFYLSPNIVETINIIAVKVRQKRPLLEGVKSAILRASIINKLINQYELSIE